jgi:hypothetical protein
MFEHDGISKLQFKLGGILTELYLTAFKYHFDFMIKFLGDRNTSTPTSCFGQCIQLDLYDPKTQFTISHIINDYDLQNNYNDYNIIKYYFDNMLFSMQTKRDEVKGNRSEYFETY